MTNRRLWIGNAIACIRVYFSMDFVIGPRLPAPARAQGEIVVKPPPELPAEAPSSPLTRLLPAAMLVATAGMMVFYLTSGSSATRNPMFMFFPVMMLGSLLGTMAVGGRGGSRTAELNRHRREYLGYLSAVDGDLADAVEQQRLSMLWHYPESTALWTIVGSRRMWERTPGEPEFGRTRVGTGSAPLSTPVVVPDLGPPETIDPVTATELRRMVEFRSAVPDIPLSVDLAEHTAIVIDGDECAGRSLLRALLCHLVVMHGPHHLRIAAVVNPFTAPEWDWLKWLPHHRHPHAVDDGGPARLIFYSLSAAESALASCTGAHVVLVRDADAVTGSHHVVGPTTTTIALGKAVPSVADLHLVIDDGLLLVKGADDDEVMGRPDAMSAGQAVAVARRLSRY
ncbi:MAG TPA: hypothetical protein VJR50_02910, partial [Mycobacterium sp.]|nr:hypothetical protein [Mycobacterium sp.]